RVVRLAADAGRIEEELGAEEHHRARRLGEPLVPTDADADGRELRLPRAKPGVAGAEVELLFVAGAVGDVALAVDAQEVAARVDDRDAVVIGLPGALEERHGNDDPELARDHAHPGHGLVVFDRARLGKPFGPLVAAEVRPLEELGRQDDARTARRRGADVPLDAGEVVGPRASERALDRPDRDLASALDVHHGPSRAGCCCVMQWNAPPPERIARASTPRARRPGKSAPMRSTASSSKGDP